MWSSASAALSSRDYPAPSFSINSPNISPNQTFVNMSGGYHSPRLSISMPAASGKGGSSSFGDNTLHYNNNEQLSIRVEEPRSEFVNLSYLHDSK
jgi:hypothetical protein